MGNVRIHVILALQELQYIVLLVIMLMSVYTFMLERDFKQTPIINIARVKHLHRWCCIIVSTTTFQVPLSHSQLYCDVQLHKPSKHLISEA